MKLPRGSIVRPEKTENFYKICGELSTAFNGALRLKGKSGEDIFMADLLIQEGKVIGASIKKVADGQSWAREEGLAMIQDKLAGSSGKLDIFEFSPEEMKRSIELNETSLLENEIPVNELGVRIKSTVIKKKPVKLGIFSRIISFFKSPSADRKADRLDEIKSSRIPKDEVKSAEGFRDRILDKHAASSDETKGREKESGDRVHESERPSAIEKEDRLRIGIPQSRPDKQSIGLPKSGAPSQGPSDVIKDSRIQAIKEKRMEKIEKLIGKDTNVAGAVPGWDTIATNIDKLYDIVNKDNVVKINDKLSTQLKVPKTQIEEWAMILEEHNLVELHYPTLGEPEIRKVEKKDR
ncbi:MAG: DUF2226 domain-containing protein [Candidatus Altiarchaeota archaeon]